MKIIKNNNKKLSLLALTLPSQIYRETNYSIVFQEQNIAKAYQQPCRVFYIS